MFQQRKTIREEQEDERKSIRLGIGFLIDYYRVYRYMYKLKAKLT